MANSKSLDDITDQNKLFDPLHAWT